MYMCVPPFNLSLTPSPSLSHSLSLSLSLSSSLSPPPHTQFDATRKHMLELERSHSDLETVNAQRRVTISQLEQQLEDREMNSGLVNELREQIDSLEEQLARLQTQVHLYSVASGAFFQLIHTYT